MNGTKTPTEIKHTRGTMKTMRDSNDISTLESSHSGSHGNVLVAKKPKMALKI